MIWISFLISSNWYEYGGSNSINLQNLSLVPEVIIPAFKQGEKKSLKGFLSSYFVLIARNLSDFPWFCFSFKLSFLILIKN